MDKLRYAARYEIHVRGAWARRSSSPFRACTPLCTGTNRVRRAVPDQAALYGVLAQVEALGLELLEVRRDRL